MRDDRDWNGGGGGYGSRGPSGGIRGSGGGSGGRNYDRGYNSRYNNQDSGGRRRYYDGGSGGRQMSARRPSFSPDSNRDVEEQKRPPRRRPDLSTSREMSREREKRRRKAQAECIRRAGGFRKLADSEGKEPVRLFWDGFQWVAKTGASSALLSDPLLVNSTRKLRRIYFGNLPLHLGLTEQNFQNILFQEMRRRGLCNNPDENPVLCVWFAKDKGNYGFVEFASVEETERALTLDGMDCLGVPIKVSRPNDYCTAPGGSAGGASATLSAFQSVQLLAAAVGANPAAAATASVSPPAAATAAAFTGVLARGGSADSELARSRCIRLRQIVRDDDLTDPDDPTEINEIFEDIKEGCEHCGKILGACILTRQNLGDLAFSPGDVFVEFETSQAAETCLSVMSQRKYFERPIQASKVLDSVFQTSIRPLLGVKDSCSSEETTAPIGEGEHRVKSEGTVGVVSKTEETAGVATAVTAAPPALSSSTASEETEERMSASPPPAPPTPPD